MAGHLHGGIISSTPFRSVSPGSILEAESGKEVGIPTSGSETTI